MSFKCAICEQDVDMFGHDRLECGKAMRQERDSALARLKVAEDALAVAADERDRVISLSEALNSEDTPMAPLLNPFREALAAIRSEAGLAKSVAKDGL